MARARPFLDLNPDILIRAYSLGLFPMAETADDPHLFWVDPEERGVFPLDRIKVSASLARTVRSDRFSVVADRDFDAVIDRCAASASDRPSTWINGRIRSLFRDLFLQGHVHTVEAYRDDALVGGLYGLAIGGAFFGESMFHRATDASKVCLVHLCARLRAGGFTLLDTQFVTPHLATLGAIAIPRNEYRRKLAHAIEVKASFALAAGADPMSGQAALSYLGGTT